MRQPRARLAVLAVTLLLGFLVVVQAQAQRAGSALEAQSPQDLTLLIANLSTRNDSLRADLADLQRRLDAMTAARARGETWIGQLRGDLGRIRLWAGVDPATGPGVRIVVTGPVAAVAVSDLLNELWNVGAEAIAVEDVRVVAGTVVAGPRGGLSIENTALGPRIEIAAIGNSGALTGALTRVGGIVSQLQATQEGISIEITPLDMVELPATERTLAPVLGRPRA
jgi:uncharacterized protein YlxW (UPF0749 family)